MSRDNASGSDGYSGAFLQKCWDIISQGIVQMVMAFFSGSELPKFISHTNVVHIPKKEIMLTYNDLRPKSLSSIVNKNISKVLYSRIEEVLTDIISKNQTSFRKGRSISENMIFAQELIRNINRKNVYHNVVVKLGIAKAYDKVSLIYLTKVMRSLVSMKESLIWFGD